MFGVEPGMGRTTLRILMSGQQFVRISIALCLLALGSGCAELETAQQAAADTLRAIVPSHLDGGFWNDEGASGSGQNRGEYQQAARLLP